MTSEQSTETVGRSLMGDANHTDDAFLGGRLQILQPANGYRAGIDPVLLASSIEAASGERVLEAGSGVGVASLCVAKRVPGVHVTGLEMQDPLVDLAQQNAKRNNLEDTTLFIKGDISAPPRSILDSSWDHVMANPPYYQEGKGLRAPNESKALSHMGDVTSLKSWVSFCLKRLKPRGTVTFVHRADHLVTLLDLLNDRVGDVRIFPLWPMPGKEAKRVLVRGMKGSHAPQRLCAGLSLHEEGRRYSHAAEKILRNGEALDWGLD